ncbi:MAG: hypothetical protein WAW41_02865, partial [Methylobacter sp.]
MFTPATCNQWRLISKQRRRKINLKRWRAIMTEGLFILTTIFVAYVVYAIMGEQKATAKSKEPAAKPEVQAAVVEQAKPLAAVAKEKPAAAKAVAPKAATKAAASKPAAKPAATKAAAPKAAAKPAATKATAAKPAAAKTAAAVETKSAGLKDPKTGEVATA